jgi:4-diphosphocytidyl-2-C-methyl-D-erythritol kinase
MPVIVRSFAKVNLGLCIGSKRADGFHDLRTVYQTVDLRDELRIRLTRGRGIEVRCASADVPCDSTNTCFRIAEKVVKSLGLKSKVVIEIRKELPVQGGLGGASGNAVSTLLAIERAAKKSLSREQRLGICAEVGSDVPLFLVGGTVLGAGRGEEVYPLPDLPPFACVLVLPSIRISTPKAFAAWDAKAGRSPRVTGNDAALTIRSASDRLTMFSRKVSAWLNGGFPESGDRQSGVPGRKRGGRAETLLLDLVRTGIENDFERVVFPQYPELSEAKRALQGSGASYASLSGSGSAVYGIFASRQLAAQAASNLRKVGWRAIATRTLPRTQYWKNIFDC